MAPFIALLVKSGLSLVANAALVRGKEYVEEKTGVKLDETLTPDALTKLRQFELENEPELMRLRVEDNRIEAELEKAKLGADVSFQANAQETARVEVQSTDEYVRRTRPDLARKSFFVGTVYVMLTGVIFPVVNEIYGLKLPALDPYILGAIYSPALTFMGVRSIEAFSKMGKR